MKPRHEEVRRMLMLALGCWNDFLNTLNSPLWSKGYISDEAFFGRIYKEMPLDIPAQQIQEALIIVAAYWGRVSDRALELGSIGLRFSKPHTQFEMMLRCSRSNQKESALLFVGATKDIDMIEYPIKLKEMSHKNKGFPSAYPLSRKKKTMRAVQKYDREMLSLLTCPDPVVRAGIQLQLVQRGFRV